MLLWQLTGMLCALGVSAVDAFIGNLRRGAGVVDSALFIPGDSAFVIVGVFLIAPLSLLGLWGWVKVVERYPSLEQSMARAIVSLSLAAGLLALIAGAISNWELLRLDADQTTFLPETLSVARSVLLWSLIGVVLPRTIVPRLRPRPAIPRIAV